MQTQVTSKEVNEQIQKLEQKHKVVNASKYSENVFYLRHDDIVKHALQQIEDALPVEQFSYQDSAIKAK